MMAFVPHTTYRAPPAAALTLFWKGAPRTLRIGRAMALATFMVLPLLAISFIGATAYLIFHDQLLASLMSRQADLQYSYEDRIAVLKTQLDRETSQALVDRQTLTTTIHDLVSRGDQLEARAVTIDGLVRSLTGSGRTAAGLGDPPLPASASLPPASDASSYDLTSPSSIGRAPSSRRDPDRAADQDHAMDSDARSEDQSALTPEEEGTRLSSQLARIDARQADEVARLRDPAIRAITRLKTALAETGLPLSRWNIASLDGGVGGPFVPLPDDARAVSVEQSIALLQDALVQHARLIGIIGKVPLRRPLQGELAVTSPFGARLDPFYGRAAMHTGVDLMQPYGGPVLATANGIVTVAGAEGGYGNMVEIDHGNGLVTRYAHLSSVGVVVHQRVAAGTVVGLVGSTGRATGPHLHYETRINGEPVDPTRFLRAGAALFRG